MRAFHMVGFDSADLFRLADGKMTKEALIGKIEAQYKAIVASGFLRPAKPGIKSRLFPLDLIVGDDQYVFLSIGKRYWCDVEGANFGFLFDAIRLVKEGAILRPYDFHSDYSDILDSVVKLFVPMSKDEFSPEEVERLMKALEDPESDYVSPNEGYYELIGAIEHQDLSVPQCKEATEEFIRRVRAHQQTYQFTGEKAIAKILREGETGRFELLVRGSLKLDGVGTVERGKIFSNV